MPRLPNADGRAVRLHLIDVPPLNPNVLRLLDGLLYDYGLLNYNGLLNYRGRCHDCRGRLHNNGFGIVRSRNSRPHYAANHTADESRPEVAAAASPVAAAVVMVATVPAVMNRRRPTPPPARRPLRIIPRIWELRFQRGCKCATVNTCLSSRYNLRDIKIKAQRASPLPFQPL